MILLEAVRRTRTLLDDFGGDRDAPWGLDDSTCDVSNRDLVAFLDEARNLYHEKFPIRDASSELTAITVADDAEGIVSLDARILAVRSVRLGDTGQKLESTTLPRLDREWSAWRGAVGEALYWLVNQEEGGLVLVPAPDIETSLRLIVDRLPEDPLDWADRADPIAETPPEHHDLLTYWAAAKALQLPGRAADELRLAGVYEARFLGLVGHPMTAQQRAVRRLTAAGPLRVRTTSF